jgi:deoxyribodipyrimidine photo-lyase
MTLQPLPVPQVGDEQAWVVEHLSGLMLEAAADAVPSPVFPGGQSAANQALENFSIRGYAASRNEVWPAERRGASKLSPYIRHGLLQLPAVWDHVQGGPARDVEKFRDELLWQEYARHLYARLGTALAHELRAEGPTVHSHGKPFGEGMRCMDLVWDELIDTGWLVNQTRMWTASHWAIRSGADWRDGEDTFFQHLLDGSRAANRLGWQWTIGTGNGKPYGFSRWQVNKRAPGTCDGCEHRHRCPIEKWPAEHPINWIDSPDPRLRRDPDVSHTSGSNTVLRTTEPEAVWLTAESLGDSDPALRAHTDLPVVFVFDETLLVKLQLSAKRLIFLTECLSELATRRNVELFRGAPSQLLTSRKVASTFAPVPGWRRLTQNGSLVGELHPWPWLRAPHSGPIGSFSAWRK